MTKQYQDKQWLEEQYSNHSTYEIAKICECGTTTIRKYLKKFGIQSRSVSESLKIKPKRVMSERQKQALRDVAVKNKKLKSEISKKLWQNQEFRERQENRKLSEETKTKISLKAKEKWQDEEYRLRAESAIRNRAVESSISLQEKWQDEEYRNKMTQQSSELWKDEEYIANQRKWADKNIDFLRATAMAVWSNELRIAKAKQTSIELWNNDKYRATIVNASVEKWKDPNYRAAISAISKSLWQNEAYRLAVTSKNRGGHFTTDEYIDKAIEIHGDTYTYEHAMYTRAIDTIIVTCRKHGNFKQVARDHLDGHGCPNCGKAIRISRHHVEIEEYIRSIYTGTITSNNTNIIRPYELDIYLPEVELAIEHHGIYYHSYKSRETPEQTFYHSVKSDLAELAGIQLLQIFENEWRDKQDIVKSIIHSKLGLNKRVAARDCEVCNVSTDQARTFLNNNHLSGYRGGSVSVGLMHDGELVMLAIFAAHKKCEWELMRLASSIGVTVVGGMSKILAAFHKNIGARSLLTYCDRRYSTAAAYLKVGFTALGITKPNYFYVRNGQIYSRQQFQRSKLPNRLESFNPAMTESANMFANNYRRLWDAGHYRLLRTW